MWKADLSHSSGYKKGIYGYLYSRVFAQDMYASVFKENLFDPGLGEKYKKSILVPGGSRSSHVSLTVRSGTLLYYWNHLN